MVVETTEVNGQKYIVDTDMMELREHTPLKELEQYLRDHEQVVDYKVFKDIDDVEGDKHGVSLGYEHAEDTGYNENKENIFTVEDIDGVSIRYIENDQTFGGDTFVNLVVDAV